MYRAGELGIQDWEWVTAYSEIMSRCFPASFKMNHISCGTMPPTFPAAGSGALSSTCTHLSYERACVHVANALLVSTRSAGVGRRQRSEGSGGVADDDVHRVGRRGRTRRRRRARVVDTKPDERLRRALLAYCQQDTLAMVQLVDHLGKAAAGSGRTNAVRKERTELG